MVGHREQVEGAYVAQRVAVLGEHRDVARQRGGVAGDVRHRAWRPAHDLLHDGYQVHVLFDCTSSRNPADRDTGLLKLQRSGVIPSTSEMVLFELMRDAKHEQFKTIQKLVK